MSDLRIGVVGTNFVSDWFCNAVKKIEGVTVSAVYSRSVERGREFAVRNRISVVYVDYDMMLASDIDAVYIASPNYIHADQAVKAMQAGKHVLCEKMMSASYAQALRMRASADKNGVVLLEAMRPDFDPATEAIKSNLARIGKIRRAHLEYCQYSSCYDRFKAGEKINAFDPSICNSALADIGVYPLHQAIYLFGRPDSVTASSVLLDNGFEGAGHLTLTYADMLCEVTYSKITESATPSVVEGEQGSIIFNRVNAPTDILFRPRGGKAEHIEFPYVEENMTCEVAAFRDMVLGTRSNIPYLETTLDTIRIANDAYRMTGAIKYMDAELMK